MCGDGGGSAGLRPPIINAKELSSSPPNPHFGKVFAGTVLLVDFDSMYLL